MRTSGDVQSMYAARVPESEKDVEEDLLAAQFDSLQRREHDIDEDDDESWDIAAFSKISIVTNGNVGSDNNVSFYADFPEAFDFTGTDNVPEDQVPEEEKKEEIFPEEEDKEEEKKEEILLEEEDKEEHKSVLKDLPEPEVDKEPEEDLPVPEPAGDQEREDLVEESRVVTPVPAEAPEPPLPVSRPTSPPMAFIMEEPPDVPVPTTSSLPQTPTVEPETEETSVSEASGDVWADISDAVRAASARAASPLALVMKMSYSNDTENEDRVPSAAPPSVSSVPTAESSSVDSSSVKGNGDDNRTRSKKLSEANEGAKSPPRILNFFRRNAGSVKSSKSAEKTKKPGGSGSKSRALKDKSTSSKEKKTKMVMVSTKSFRRQDKERAPPAARKKKKEAGPERETRIYKIMRKKPKGGRCSNAENASFLEDFADEFFTCSYFFKCLGEVVKTKGKEMPCCECIEAMDEDETISIADPEDVLPEGERRAQDPPGIVTS